MVVDIAGRKPECKKLEQIYREPQAALLAVYGRRRIGKTHLIKHFFKGRGIYFQVTGMFATDTTFQLANFGLEFNEVFLSDDPLPPPGNWQEAFDRLRKAITQKRETSDEKIILFFDELPWLAGAKTGFMQALEHCWNRYLADIPNLIMVVCGSAASWMIKNVIQQKGGLHGRVTHKLHLKPFTLAEAEAFLQSRNIRLNRKQLVDIYMALGGVAHYLKGIKPGQSAAQSIDALCFSEHGEMQGEFKNLFRSLFKGYQRHIEIIRALASKRAGLPYKEIVAITGMQSGGGLTDILDELIAAGFIDKVVEFGDLKKAVSYRLIDEYSLFYLKWCESVTAYDQGYWLRQQNSSAWKSWSGFAFENVCLKHVPQIKVALGIAGVLTQSSQWVVRGKNETNGAQIDLVVDRADQCINLCEIKYYQDTFTITKGYAEALRHKKNTFIETTDTKKAVFTTMVTTYGVVDNAYSTELVDQQIVLDDLFAN